MSPYKFDLPGAPPKPGHVHVAPCPDVYRGIYRASDLPEGSDLGKMYGDSVGQICDEVVDRLRGSTSKKLTNGCTNGVSTKVPKRGEGVCAFFAESLISCGGQVVLPEGYLETAYRHVRAAGGVCVADEVQVGFGRTGKWWAFEHQTNSADKTPVCPDIVTMGKPMGNGHPVAAVVTTQEIAKSFQDTGVGYFNTYGGNPVSCAIANAVLDVLEETDVLTHAKKLGDVLIQGGERLKEKHQLIGDVRGEGLFVGYEMVEDRIAKVPATEKAKWIVSRIREKNHMLLSTDGPHGNVIKVKPPMVFTEQNCFELLKALDEILCELETLEKEQNRNSNAKMQITMNQTTNLSSCHVNTVPAKSKRDLIKSI